MHDGQGLGDAVHHRQQPGLVHGALPLGQGLLERVATVQRHHHVGGALFLPEAVHLQQGRVVELRQQPRFVDEAAHTEVEGLLVPLRQGHHGAVVLAAGQRRRHVLLDRHHPLQGVVPGFIDDAEAALPHQAGDLELGHPGAHRQHPALAGGFTHSSARLGRRRQPQRRRRDDAGGVVRALRQHAGAALVGWQFSDHTASTPVVVWMPLLHSSWKAGPRGSPSDVISNTPPSWRRAIQWA